MVVSTYKEDEDHEDYYTYKEAGGRYHLKRV